MENSGIRYKLDDIGSVTKDEAHDRVVEISKTVYEYISIMEKSPILIASSLDEKHRLLAHYNGCVLAARDSDEGRGASFVTWERDFDGKGVHHGHYYENDYEAAKADFAGRSGLVYKHRLFSNEQLSGIYRCIGEALDNDFERTASEEEMLRGVQRQIQYALPDVQERLISREPAQTQQFNM